ncbi:MAG: sigma-70 family RNA polymerase sigma factor [Planctomycetota bacterium]
MPPIDDPLLPPEDPEPPLGAEGAEVDHALIRRAQAGEEEAFALLVQRHEARACRVAAGLVANREDARDLAQEAFLRVFRSLDRFDFRHEFTTWLYRIVTNLAIDHLRRRRPAVSTAAPGEEEADLELHDAGAPSPAAALEREETAIRVRACLERLPAHFQSVMVLRELEGLSCKEIAAIVGATHVTVRWRLHRGRKLFQDEWERMARQSAAPGGETPANTARPRPVQPSGDARGVRPGGTTDAKGS